MKLTYLFLFVSAGAMVAGAQTTANPATAAKPALAAAKSAAPSATSKLPPGVPRVKGELKTAFALKYQDVVIGKGADAAPMKLYKIKYTGYRAADGVKFDAWDMHQQPLRDKDGKPVLGDDGKPKMGDAEPASFPIGMGRVIPGFDQGFGGMKVGGKRRLFIPWQLAYGTREIPDHGPDHPGIPAKSDLIFDVELVDIADMPTPPSRPAMGGMPPGGRPMPGGPHGTAPGTNPFGKPAAPAAPPAPGAAPATPAAPAAKAPAATAAPATPAAAPAPAAPAAPAQAQPK
jgi:peptidylprolyl isomerase